VNALIHLWSYTAGERDYCCASGLSSDCPRIEKKETQKKTNVLNKWNRKTDTDSQYADPAGAGKQGFRIPRIQIRRNCHDDGAAAMRIGSRATGAAHNKANFAAVHWLSIIA
jgi:hypothetical protein